MPDDRKAVKLEVVGALTVGAGKDRYAMPFPGEIINVDLAVGTAPTGAALNADILKNGVTVYSTVANVPSIAIGAVTSSAANRVLRPDVVGFAAGDVLSLSVTQVGSTVAGSDLDATIQYITL